MYQTIMVPVDLAHADRLEKAIAAAATLSRVNAATLHFVGVTPGAPTEVARNPAAFAAKLENFAAVQGELHGVPVKAHAVVHNDVDRALDDQIKALGADLVVMASHKPGLKEFVLGSNAGHLAAHSPISVFVVR
ncbi:MAG: universal stress protein [Rhodobacteraceae bacterium]|nr:MAG: universal stress protein [Paracoccaceae bacterium]